MKSNWPTYLFVFATVLVLAVDQRLDLLAVVAPISIVVGMIALHYAGTASVEYRRKR